jgi:hypothetical protein
VQQKAGVNFGPETTGPKFCFGKAPITKQEPLPTLAGTLITFLALFVKLEAA